MFILFDTLSILFWSAAYLLIIICSFQDKKLRMPLIVGAVCFAWELNALLLVRHWGHVAWFALDCFILYLNLCGMKQRKQRRIPYVFFTVFAVIGLFFLFRAPWFDGMLISSFVLDIAIAIAYVLRFREIAIRGKVAVATAKLLGDLSALLAYGKDLWIIAVIGTLVLLLNLIYLSACLEEQARTHRQNNNKRRGCR